MLVNNALDYSLLHRLTQSFGPSGNESEVAHVISKEVTPMVESLQVDPLGNLITRKRGEGRKILISCHMDEVGIIVTSIDHRGFLYFSAVGGLKAADLNHKRVRFVNKRVGVISEELRRTDEGKTMTKYFIDIGVDSETKARQYVKEGDMAVLVGDFSETESHIISKALDNRVGCFIALEVLKKIESQDDLYFVFSAQEEVGARGAKIAAYQIEPDLALIIDTTISFDKPREENQTGLNKGVAIKAMDRTIVVSPRIKNWMAEVAINLNIPFQWEIITAGGTDAGPVHLTKYGIPTGGIAIPTRYLHTGNEVVAKKDIIAAYNLVLALISNPYNANESER